MVKNASAVGAAKKVAAVAGTDSSKAASFEHNKIKEEEEFVDLDTDGGVDGPSCFQQAEVAIDTVVNSSCCEGGGEAVATDAGEGVSGGGGGGGNGGDIQQSTNNISNGNCLNNWNKKDHYNRDYCGTSYRRNYLYDEGRNNYHQPNQKFKKFRDTSQHKVLNRNYNVSYRRKTFNNKTSYRNEKRQKYSWHRNQNPNHSNKNHKRNFPDSGYIENNKASGSNYKKRNGSNYGAESSTDSTIFGKRDVNKFTRNSDSTLTHTPKSQRCTSTNVKSDNRKPSASHSDRLNKADNSSGSVRPKIEKAADNKEGTKASEELKKVPAEPVISSQNCAEHTGPSKPPRSTIVSQKSPPKTIEVTRPKISLIPLAKLIRNELLDLHVTNILQCSDKTPVYPASPSTNPTVGSTTKPNRVCKPNLVQRRRKISSSSNANNTTDNLVDKVVNMDKNGIQNVINSTDTKYDEALKVQARRRLREEIRKQLKTMNLEKPRASAEQIDLEADAIVESIHIPEVVLDEIRKAFGIELMENGETSKAPNQNGHCVAEPDVLRDVGKDAQGSVNVESSGDQKSTEPTRIQSVPTAARRMSTDLMSRINTAKQLKSFAERSTPKDQQRHQQIRTASTSSETVFKEAKTTKKERNGNRSKGSKPRKKAGNPNKPSDVIVIDSSGSSASSANNSSASSGSSSSSSSPSSSSSEDSDSDSNASMKSSSSSVRRRRQKLKIIADNVVKSFETLILCSLSEAQRQRYKEKYSSSNSMKLHYISCICTSDYNSKQFSKTEIAKVQRNLKTEDNSSSLDFLMHEIVNVFNKQKVLRQEKEKTGGQDNSSAQGTETVRETHGEAARVAESVKEQQKISSETSELMRPQNEQQSTKSNEVESNSNRIEAAAAVKSKTAKAAEKFNAASEATCSNSSEKVSGVGRRKDTTPKAKRSHDKGRTSKKRGVAGEDVADSATNSKEVGGNNKRRVDEIIAADKPNSINVLEDMEKIGRRDEKLSDDSQINSSNVGESCRTNTSCHSRSHMTPTIESQHRQWRSSGENKSIPEALTSRITTTPTSSFYANLNVDTHAYASGFPASHRFKPQESVTTTSSPFHGLDHVAPLGSISNYPTFPNNMALQPHVLFQSALDAPKLGGLIGESIVTNLRDIDAELMELHKRKMFIEEMIMKLQKEKMESDLQTIRLQNKKFMLLNTAMTANATVAASAVSTSAPASPSTTSNSATAMEKPSSSTQSPTATRPDHSKDCGTNTDAEEFDARRVYTAEKRKRSSSKTSASNRKKLCQQDLNEEPSDELTAPKSSSRKISSTSKRITTSRNRKATATIKPVNKTVKQRVAKSKENSEATNNPDASSTIPPDDKISQDDCPQIAPDPTNDSPSKNHNTADSDHQTTSFDYSKVPVGYLDGIKSPVTQICVFEDSIIASSEDGTLYKYNILTLRLEKHFAKHSEAITQMYLCQQKKVLYTTSLDGYLKRSSIENFDLDIQTDYLEEPLQSIDVKWGVAFIGSRWGNVFTYDIMTNHLSGSTLCSTNSSIIALKATKEGPRKILIVSSKGNLIHFRDANSGLLLRTLHVPENLNIFSLLLEDGCLYYGTQKNQIYKYDFTTGTHLAVMSCGNGAVAMKVYRSKFIFVGCYDGFVYVLDKETGCQVGRFPGSGKMVLSLEIAGDKLLTSAKNNSLQIIDIPKYIAAKVTTD